MNMNWISALFRRPNKSINGAVVFLDRDMLSKEQIERIKQRMTPVFVEYSSSETYRLKCDVKQAVTQAA